MSELCPLRTLYNHAGIYWLWILKKHKIISDVSLIRVQYMWMSLVCVIRLHFLMNIYFWNFFTACFEFRAPRYMGEGFIVLQTRKIDIHFYMDEPGIVATSSQSRCFLLCLFALISCISSNCWMTLCNYFPPGIVPYEPESVELADGETVVRRTYPCLGMDVKCGKNTDINYGPWVDKQRYIVLWNAIIL